MKVVTHLKNRTFSYPLSLLALGGFLAFGISVMSGSVTITLPDMKDLLKGDASPLVETIVFELRVPRALAAFGTGGLLSMAGALMQILLRNPLADPYVLGLSGGAAAGALSAMLLGFGVNMVSGSAFAGALLSMLIVFGLASGTSSWTPTRLLLTGIIVSSGWSALIAFLLTVGPSNDLPGMLYWLMGDLSYARTPWPALVALVMTCIVLTPLGRNLNILARGTMQAAALGVSVRPLELFVYVLASFMTAVAVTTAGSIGFVGLVVPHILRLVLGNDQRLILPACALTGGALLMLADTCARTLFAPEQLPVGIITTLLGVPVFLYLLYRSGR